jgi:hypothetical protein
MEWLTELASQTQEVYFWLVWPPEAQEEEESGKRAGDVYGGFAHYGSCWHPFRNHGAFIILNVRLYASRAAL